MLGNGILISPLPEEGGVPQKSLREMIAGIDNTTDFNAYITSFSGKIPTKSADLKYEKHPVSFS